MTIKNRIDEAEQMVGELNGELCFECRGAKASRGAVVWKKAGEGDEVQKKTCSRCEGEFEDVVRWCPRFESRSSEAEAA